MNDIERQDLLIRQMVEYIAKWHEGDLEVSHPSDPSHDESNWSWEDTDSLVYLIESFLFHIGATE
jgi:hypothetical protein